MTALEAAIEDALAKLPDAEWAALEARVRGPRHHDYPAKPRGKNKPKTTPQEPKSKGTRP